jgi:lysyl endopeptidase
MKPTLLFVNILLSFVLFSQQGSGGLPASFSFDFYPQYPIFTFQEPDLNLLRSQDSLTDGKGIAPWRFGFVNPCDLNVNNSGKWHDLPNGGKLWLLQVECENALTVNLTFQNSIIPEGNELFIYNANRDFILGKFTEKHLYMQALGSELIPGSEAIIEYYVAPENINHLGHIEISSVTHGYRTSDEYNRAFGSSGSCNMNVNCPDGAPFENQRNSVVMLVAGSNGFCTGSLINNTANDGKPYVLTARHCGTNPTTWTFRFNWQAANCNNPSSSPGFQSLSGAVLRAASTSNTFDMCLVEITGGLENETIPESYNPFFAGWDNSGVVPNSTFCIHHPSGDIKKIAFDDNAAATQQAMGSTVPESTWRVSWDRGTTTEPGSSGSALFDSNGRIIGQLWGGGASCTNLEAPDYYGRVSMSWNPPGSSSSQQLKHWLDPLGTDVLFINGYPNIVPPNLDARIQADLSFLILNCSNELKPVISIFNEGKDTITDLVIHFGYEPLEQQSFNWQGSLAFGKAVTIELPSTILEDGQYTFYANIASVNGETDDNFSNNEINSGFVVTAQGFEVDLLMQLDCWGGEITWRLLNQEGQQIFSGGPYTEQSNQLISDRWCLAESCFILEINDSFGDGFGGGFGCQTTGYLQVLEGENLLTEIPESQANFGNQRRLSFCLGNATNSLDHLGIGTANTHIFPNPTEGSLNLIFDVDGSKKITILSTQGAIVSQFDVHDTEASLNLSSLTFGVYFVEIRFGERIEIHKIIKQ